MTAARRAVASARAASRAAAVVASLRRRAQGSSSLFVALLAVAVALTACGDGRDAARTSASTSTTAAERTTTTARDRGDVVASFPAGTYRLAVSPADNPPSPRLIGDYTLELDASGSYRLTGPSFVAEGIYDATIDLVTLRRDSRCRPGEVGTYRWTSDGSSLRFEAAGADECDRAVGGRQFLFTLRPWSRA